MQLRCGLWKTVVFNMQAMRYLIRMTGTSCRLFLVFSWIADDAGIVTGRMQIKKGQEFNPVLFLYFQQHPQNLIIRKGRMGIGCVQNGFHVIHIILDFLGE